MMQAQDLIFAKEDGTRDQQEIKKQKTDCHKL